METLSAALPAAYQDYNAMDWRMESKDIFPERGEKVFGCSLRLGAVFEVEEIPIILTERRQLQQA